jgi:nucleotide-binding universal stress UspA family protein
MEKVLIAIDYNLCAQKIAETGFEYARAMKAEVCIVHAISDIAYYAMEYSPIMGFEGFGADSSFETQEQQQNEATRFLAAVVKHLGGSHIKTKVLDGKTAEAILQYACEYKADLIVIGAHSRNGIEKIMGDVAAKVIQNAVIPILIVPADKVSQRRNRKMQDTLQYI